MFLRSVRILLICAGLCCLTACSNSWLARWLSGADTQQNPQKISVEVLPPPPATVVTPNPESLNADTKTDIHAEGKYSTAIHSLLIQQQFDTLDTMANSLRESKTKFSGGSWKLFTFYEGLVKFPGRNNVGQGDWQSRILLLQRWVSLKPESVTARVGLAEAYYDYAWQARGSGYANSVQDYQWKQFEDRLKLAKQTLDEAAQLKVRCPQWYQVMLRIALGQGWDREQEDALFAQAIAFEPTYRSYYIQYGYYLMPKWFGREGEWESFAERISTQLGPKEGPIIYFRIATNFNCCDYDGSAIFTTAHLSWEKVKQGCHVIEQVYGTSLDNLNDCARLAGEAEDRPYAKQLFGRIGDNWDPDTWRTRQAFDAARAWALSK